MSYRAAFILLLIFGLFPPSLLANKIYFSQVVFGGGYETEFAVVNTGSTTVSAQVVFFGQDGTPRPDLTTPIVVTPGGTTRFTLPDNGSLTVVWAELDAGTGTVAGVATFSLRSNGVLTTAVGVLGSSAGTSFLIPVDVSPTGSTGVAIANVNDGVALNVTLRLISENGTTFATSTDARFLPMVARGQVAAFADEIFPQLAGTTFRGTLAIEAGGGGVAVTALTVNGGIFSSLPVLTGDGTGGTSSLYFPQVVFGGGYSTTFVVMNTGTVAVSGTLSFYDQQGNSRPDLTAAVNIPVGGSARVTIPNAGPLTVVWGELILPAGAQVQGVATYDLRDGSGTLTATVGVLGVEADTVVVVPVTATTGVAVANLGDSSAIVTLRLRATDGTDFAIATDPVFNPMAPRSQVARFVTELFPQVQGTSFTGSLVIEHPLANAIVLGFPKPNAIHGTTPVLGVTGVNATDGIFTSVPVIASSAGSTGGGGTGGGSGGAGGGTGGGGSGGGGTGGEGPVTDCFDPTRITGANTEHLEYAISDGTNNGTWVSDVVVTPNSMFQGNQASERADTRTTTFMGFSITQVTKTYQALMGFQIIDYGSITEATIPFMSTTTTVHNPPRLDPSFTLGLNETAATTYMSTITTVAPPLPDSVQTVTQTQVTTYRGQGEVTTPAGTFDVCIFEDDGGALTSLNKGNGVLIQGTAEGFTLELTSGNINGMDIN